MIGINPWVYPEPVLQAMRKMPHLLRLSKVSFVTLGVSMFEFGKSSRIFRLVLLLIFISACGGEPQPDPPQAQVSIRFVQPAADLEVDERLEIELQVENYTGEVDLLLDGQLLTSLSAPYRYTWNTSEVVERSYKLEARAAGVSSEARYVTVMHPELLLSSSGSLFTNGSIDFEISLRGAAADNVFVFADGELIADLRPPYQFSWDTSRFPEGVYEVKAKANRGVRSVESNRMIITVDRTPPRILRRSPANGDIGVVTSQPIELAFSEAMDAKGLEGFVTLTDVSTGLLGDLNVRSSLTQTNVVTVDLQDTRELPERITASIQDSLTDLAGNPLDLSDPSWSWTLAYWERLEPEQDFSLISDVHKGRIYAVEDRQEWVTDSEGQRQFVSRSYVYQGEGSSWQRLGSYLNARVEESVKVLALLTDGEGQPVVLLQQGSLLQVQRWDNQVWRNLRDVPLPEAARVKEMRLNTEGKLQLSWTEPAAEGYSLNTAVWQAEQWQLHSNYLLPAELQDFKLQFDLQDRPVLAFSETVNENASHVRVLRWEDGWRSVGGPIYNDPNGQHAVAVLIMDTDDQPLLAVTQRLDMGMLGYEDLLFVFRRREAGWQPLGQPQGFANVQDVKMVLDQKNQPVLAWRNLNWDSTSIGQIKVSHWRGNYWEMLDREYLSDDRGKAPVQLYGFVSSDLGGYYISFGFDRWRYLLRYNRVIN